MAHFKHFRDKGKTVGSVKYSCQLPAVVASNTGVTGQDELLTTLMVAAALYCYTGEPCFQILMCLY